jgi:C_GCAxxG_C_C family probable redox protein
MSKSEMAVQLFKDGSNCSQAILTIFGQRYGMDPEFAHTIGRSLGGGLGRSGNTCGAITGAIAILGLAQGNPEDEAEARNKIARTVQEFLHCFEERHGSLLCRELLNADMSTEAGQRKIKENQLVSRLCPAFVKDAAEILSELLPMAHGERSSAQAGRSCPLHGMSSQER